MNALLFLLSLLNVINIINSVDSEQKQMISDEEFIKIMNSQERVIGGSDIHLKMYSLSNRAMQITDKINNKYNTPQEIRKLMSELIGQELDEGFGLFPPFYTDCGRNTHIEKNVFIKPFYFLIYKNINI